MPRWPFEQLFVF